MVGPQGLANARDEVQAAWEHARASGSYHFAVDVTQRTIPMPTVTNVGRRSRQDALRLEGQADLHVQVMQLTLWSQGGSVLNSGDGLEIRVEGNRAFARQGNGTWEEQAQEQRQNKVVAILDISGRILCAAFAAYCLGEFSDRFSRTFDSNSP